MVQWHVGHVIRNLRESVKWSLADLSRESGVSVAVINRIERGHTREPKRATLEQLAHAFGLPGFYDLLVHVSPTTLVVLRPPTRKRVPASSRGRHADGVVDLVAPRKKSTPKRKRA